MKQLLLIQNLQNIYNKFLEQIISIQYLFSNQKSLTEYIALPKHMLKDKHQLRQGSSPKYLKVLLLNFILKNRRGSLPIPAYLMVRQSGRGSFIVKTKGTNLALSNPKA